MSGLPNRNPALPLSQFPSPFPSLISPSHISPRRSPDTLPAGTSGNSGLAFGVAPEKFLARVWFHEEMALTQTPDHSI